MTTTLKTILGISLAANLFAANIIYHQHATGQAKDVRIGQLHDFAEDAKGRVDYLSATVSAGMLALVGGSNGR